MHSVETRYETHKLFHRGKFGSFPPFTKGDEQQRMEVSAQRP